MYICFIFVALLKFSVSMDDFVLLLAGGLRRYPKDG